MKTIETEKFQASTGDADDYSPWCVSVEYAQELQDENTALKTQLGAIKQALAKHFTHCPMDREIGPIGDLCTECGQFNEDGCKPDCWVGQALAGTLTAEPSESKPDATKCPHCKSDLLWSEDRGAHCDGCDDFDPEADLPPIVTDSKPDAWLPIESAPEESYGILVSDGKYVTAAQRQDSGWWEINNDPTDSWGSELFPTHRQPLPKAPATTGENGGVTARGDA